MRLQSKSATGVDVKATTANIEGVFAGNGASFGPMGSVPPLNSDDQKAQRRSQRVVVKVSVTVLAKGADNKAGSEETCTVTVNAHGAMIMLGLKVSIGQLLTLRNSTTGEETSRRRLYGALPAILAHRLSSTGLDNSKSRSKRELKPARHHTDKFKTEEMRSVSRFTVVP